MPKEHAASFTIGVAASLVAAMIPAAAVGAAAGRLTANTACTIEQDPLLRSAILVLAAAPVSPFLFLGITVLLDKMNVLQYVDGTRGKWWMGFAGPIVLLIGVFALAWWLMYQLYQVTGNLWWPAGVGLGIAVFLAIGAITEKRRRRRATTTG